MGESMKELANWFSMLGVPTIFVISSWCAKACASFFKQLKILQEAQKAQMRAQLIEKYYEVKDRGFIWSDEADEFANQYKAYHQLKGPNEVLDNRKDEIMAMPSKVR